MYSLTDFVVEIFLFIMVPQFVKKKKSKKKKKKAGLMIIIMHILKVLLIL